MYFQCTIGDVTVRFNLLVIVYGPPLISVFDGVPTVREFSSGMLEQWVLQWSTWVAPNMSCVAEWLGALPTLDLVWDSNITDPTTPGQYEATFRCMVIRAAIGRYDRSCGRSIKSIGSVGSVILQIFQFFCHVGELEICLVSKFQLCTTLGGRKNAEKPKCEFSEFSVRSVRYSIRFDRYCVRGSWWTALVKWFL